MKTYIVTVTPPARSLLEVSRHEIDAVSQAEAIKAATKKTRPGCTYSVREADVSSYCLPFVDSAMGSFNEVRALA